MAEPILLQPTGLVILFLRSLKTYLRNLPALLLLGIILLLPALIIFGIVAVLLVEMENTFGFILYILAVIAVYVVFFYFYACATLAVSLSIIGLKAGVIQILRRIGGKVGIQIFGTGLLLTLIIYGGLLLLIIPGIIWMIRYQFALPIVVLERTAYKSALRRSKQLVDGSWWRLFGAMWIGILCFYVIAFLFGVILYIPLRFLGVQQELAFNIALLGIYFAMPITFIYPVHLYYDLRVRKEAFNVETIREAV